MRSVRAARATSRENRATTSPPSNVMSHRQTGVAYRVLVDMIAGLLVGGSSAIGSTAGWVGRRIHWWRAWFWASSPASTMRGAPFGCTRRMRPGATTGIVACPEAVALDRSGDEVSQMHSPMEQFEIKRLLNFNLVSASTPRSRIPRPG